MFKLAIASLLVAASLAGLPKPDFGLLSDEEIHYINNVAKTTWKAGRNFHPKDNAYVKSMIGFPGALKSKDLRGRLPRKQSSESISMTDLPTSFDAREQWPNCPSIREIKDQGNCENSWAVVAASVMTDRLCIFSKSKEWTHLSAQDLLDCCEHCGTYCKGGDPGQAWKYLLDTGVVSGGPWKSSKGCKEFKFQPCEHHGISGDRPPCNQTIQPAQHCVRECRDGYLIDYDFDTHYVTSAFYVKGEKELMEELTYNGPVQTTMWVYTDFLHYKSGVYQQTSGRRLSRISVKIIGYGVENGTKYWLVANSWNTDWGDKGFFKIIKGEDECTLETNGVAGQPEWH